MDAGFENATVSGLWNAIRDRLDRGLRTWRDLIDHFGQVAAAEQREAGRAWGDDEVFEALLRAVLSNNTDWSKVESVLPELQEVFDGFSLKKYAAVTDADVENRIVPWFKQRKAGSMTLKRSLQGLARTAGILGDWSAAHGSAEHYFLKVIADAGGDPKLAAVEIGKPGTRRKLPALGIPIAAEAMRNLGFDVCKPDRHVCRALGSFGLVQFRKWPDRTGTKAPEASAGEMLDVMRAVETMARLNEERPTFLDNAIWLLCARMGLNMTNDDLAAMAAGCREDPA